MFMNKKEKDFIKTVREYYQLNGRHSLPWRKTRNPYRILISEIMLQQTQVDRVIPKYKNFLQLFPTVNALSQASLGDVLRAWQGLGYNRRAKMLLTCAQMIVGELQGSFPKTYEGLIALPGVGPYTAGAVLAFSEGVGVSVIETNIRTVILHHFFNDATDVSDAEILKIVARTLDTENPREWYYALMDYGAHIKKTIGNPNSRSKHYTKQSVFKDSDRQIRGAILKLLADHEYTRQELHKVLPFDVLRIDVQLERLSEEGLIMKGTQKYHLP